MRPPAPSWYWTNFSPRSEASRGQHEVAAIRTLAHKPAFHRRRAPYGVLLLCGTRAARGHCRHGDRRMARNRVRRSSGGRSRVAIAGSAWWAAPMSLRAVLLALIVLATAGFVVGTTIERNSGESPHESAATLRAEGRAETGSESERTLAAEAAAKSESTPTSSTAARRRTSHTTGESKAVRAVEIGGKTETGGESRAVRVAERTKARPET